VHLRKPVGNITIVLYRCVLWIHRTDNSSVHHVFPSHRALFPRYSFDSLATKLTYSSFRQYPLKLFKFWSTN
jgi:hypothetical protein